MVEVHISKHSLFRLKITVGCPPCTCPSIRVLWCSFREAQLVHAVDDELRGSLAQELQHVSLPAAHEANIQRLVPWRR